MKNSSSMFFKEFVKAWCIISAVFFITYFVIVGYGWTIIANAAPAPKKIAGVPRVTTMERLQSYTDKPNLVKTSGNYLQASTNYEVDGKTVLTIDLFYRLQKDGTYKAVYYNAVSADGGISFSERDIADTDNVIYVDDNNLGLAKGQAVYAEIQDLLDEVGYN